MATKLPSHLHKNRYGIYGFRIVIPMDLRLKCRKTEIRISLRTASLSKAKPLAYRYTLLTDTYFDKMRRAPTYDDAVAAGVEYLQHLTSEGVNFESTTEMLEELIGHSNSADDKLLHKLISLRRGFSSVSASKTSKIQAFAAQLSALQETASDAEIDSITCDFYAEITPLIGKENSIHSELNEFTLEAQKILLTRLYQRDIETLQQSQKAEINTITDLAAEITAKATLKVASAVSEGAATEHPTKNNSEPLAAIVEAYCQNQISEGSWTLKTEAENRAIYALWIRIVGDQPIKCYGFEQHRDYKTTISKLPANLNKSPRYRDKGIVEILSLNCPPAAPNTINKNLVRISALFDWAIKYGYTKLNPASGMTIKNPKRANEERQAFTDDDLCKLFNSPEYTLSGHRHPYQFWVPLIALYTGARLNEICQLHLNDFGETDGMKVIQITEEGGNKRLKTKAAKRTIPIHQELIRIGLLEYVDALRQASHLRLFPELKERRDGYGQTVTKWFASYRKKCGINEAGKVFHSFRHTVIDCLKQADVAKEKIAALVGHEDDSVTFGRYGKEFRPAVLLEVIEKLQFAKGSKILKYFVWEKI